MHSGGGGESSYVVRPNTSQFSRVPREIRSPEINEVFIACLGSHSVSKIEMDLNLTFKKHVAYQRSTINIKTSHTKLRFLACKSYKNRSDEIEFRDSK